MPDNRNVQIIKIPDLALDLRASLKTNLKILAATHWSWIHKSEIFTFARENLHVEPELLDDWHRQAGWGYLASRLTETYRMHDRIDELQELVEPIDFSLIEQAMREGRGVMLATAHGSATLAGYRGIGNVYPNIMPLTSSPYWSQMQSKTGVRLLSLVNRQGVSDHQDTMKNHLLHNNGIVANNCDGRYGSRFIYANFLGQEVTVYTGFAAMAKKIGAPTVWAKMTWSDVDRIKVSFEPIEVDISLDDESWVRSWYEQYLNKLSSQFKASPRDIGFKAGLWNTQRGGLKWRS